ncbi:hypothetical protein [Listeria cornellensis]|uniref:Uncharacterized protein n=1 Tax=Listeria cornellensis FSL F6-0969 TaxID=1265820 RepID=W7BRL3_9LIST|nr:hypothetical protein [Listeria cornellensis]EUJ29374.1 hypothetical protein PCORN_09292 [Listeria cornellensis FSL F6-0969]
MTFNRLDVLDDALKWEIGTISAASGSLVSATNRIRSQMILLESGTIIDLINFEKFQMTILIYDMEGQYINTTGWIRERYQAESTRYYAIVLANTNNSSLVGLVNDVSAQLQLVTPDKLELSICESRLDAQKKTRLYNEF